MVGKRHLGLLIVSLCRRQQTLSMSSMSMTYRPVNIKALTSPRTTIRKQLGELMQHSSLSRSVRLMTGDGLLRPSSCICSGSFHLPRMDLKSLEKRLSFKTVANFCTTTTPGTSPTDSKPSSNKSSGITTSENIYTIPNALCVMRIGMAPVAAYMIINSQFGPALGVFAVAGVTDLLDGWIARVVPGQATVMGSFLDPMADKILVGTLFLSLTYMDLIPVLLTGLIIGRDAILILSGFYIRYQSLDPPRTIARYWDITYPTAQLAPTVLSKVNTGVQLGLVGATMISAVLPYDVHTYLEFLWYFTATSTVASAVGYLFAKDTVKLLRKRGRKSDSSREK